MKKLAVLFASMIFLSGCSSPVWETVNDSIPAQPAAARPGGAYAIEVSVPEEAALLGSAAGWEVYATDDSELEIETRTFLASSPEIAIETISGLDADNLTVLETSRFDLPEYQFIWVTQTDQGSRVCHADLVMDDTNCYAVICSVQEAQGNIYDDEIRQVFATFDLFVDEGV